MIFYKSVITLFLLCGLTTVSSQDTTNIVEYLLGLIFEAFQSVSVFSFPTDASLFKALEKPVEDYDEADFVIIGAGVTGCAFANRLSEVTGWKILVLETGNYTDNTLMRIPGMFGLKIFSDYNWGFRTVPQTGACRGTTDLTCALPRGRGVGGTTLINSLQYVRANSKNFNLWAKLLKDDSWKYEEVLKYFKKSEKFIWKNPKAPVDPNYHGDKGLLQVEHRMPDFPLNDIFLEANEQLGYKIIDYNGHDQVGASIIQVYTKNGTREDMGTVFVTPFLDRPNLKVLTESYVTKIEINNTTKIAKSVLFTNSGKTFRVKANKEILLCAGAVHSPQILMLSGIGPKEHLESVGIETIEDLGGVGRLKEHVLLSNFQFSSNLTIPTEPLPQQIVEYLQGYGPLTVSSTQAQCIGFYDVNCKSGTIPNIVLFMDALQSPELEQRLMGWSNETYQWVSNPAISNPVRFFMLFIQPKSVGTIRLKSQNPFDYPLINPNLLNKNKDLDTMFKGIQQIFSIANTTAFKKSI